MAKWLKQNSSSAFGILVAAVLAGVVAINVAEARINAHMREARIHKGVEELSQVFVPRETLKLELKIVEGRLGSIEESMGRIENYIIRQANEKK